MADPADSKSSNAERERAAMIKRISATSLMNIVPGSSPSRAGSGLSRSQSTKIPQATTPRRTPSVVGTPLVGLFNSQQQGSPSSSESGSENRASKSEKGSKKVQGFAQLQQAFKKLRKAPSSSSLAIATSNSSSSPGGSDRPPEIKHSSLSLRKGVVPKRARRARSVRSREKASASNLSTVFPNTLTTSQEVFSAAATRFVTCSCRISHFPGF